MNYTIIAHSRPVPHSDEILAPSYIKPPDSEFTSIYHHPLPMMKKKRILCMTNSMLI